MKRLITRNKAVITASIAAILLIVAGFITAKQPVPKSPIKFSHKLHVVDQGIECLDCHASVPQAGARTHLIPNHEVCANCHSDEVENQSKCGMCHINPEDPQPVPQRAGRYEGFAHKLHTKLDCAQCHGAITEAHQNPSIPKMLDCQSCHTTMKGPLDCKICHLGVKPKPSDHQSGLWIQDHGLEAAAATTDCRQCHDQSNCDDCHQGTKVFGAKNSPHPPDWIFNHFAVADYGNQCLVCHESRTSCTECHRRMIPVPHTFGPEWANPKTGGAHRDEFQTYTATCLACHDQGIDSPVCANCHRKD